jgi:hypothetical protein
MPEGDPFETLGGMTTVCSWDTLTACDFSLGENVPAQVKITESGEVTLTVYGVDPEVYGVTALAALRDNLSVLLTKYSELFPDGEPEAGDD